MKIIDIHNHLAWDVDDGISCQEDTVTVLNQARSEGITTIVATPHFVPGMQKDDDISNINHRLDELKELAQNYDILILKGCEMFVNHSFLDMVDSHMVNTIENTNYLLVEFDVRKQLGRYDEVEDYLYELGIRNYRVIIAHIERYFPKGLDLERIEALLEAGYVFQINKGSLLGIYGKTIQKNALTLLDRGMVHIVASDCHRIKGRDVSFKKVYNLLIRRYGEMTAQQLCYINPLHVIKNEDVEKIEKRNRFLRILKRR